MVLSKVATLPESEVTLTVKLLRSSATLTVGLEPESVDSAAVTSDPVSLAVQVGAFA